MSRDAGDIGLVAHLLSAGGYPAYPGPGPGRLFYFRAAAARRLRVAVAVSFWAPSRSEATKAAAVTGGVRLGEELP